MQSANTVKEISKTQPNISNNEIPEHLEQRFRDIDKTPSNAIIDIQTLTLQNSLLSGNLETPQDIRNIRLQFFVLKSYVMCEFSALS